MRIEMCIRDRLYILDNRKGLGYLSPSNFKNLIGRVCRFSEIFKEEPKLKKLEPEIYLVISEFFRNRAQVEKYLQKTMKDVYKRQVLHYKRGGSSRNGVVNVMQIETIRYQFKRICEQYQIKDEEGEVYNLTSHQSVSYTHLDVYKRQLPDPPTRGPAVRVP